MYGEEVEYSIEAFPSDYKVCVSHAVETSTGCFLLINIYVSTSNHISNNIVKPVAFSDHCHVILEMGDGSE